MGVGDFVGSLKDTVKSMTPDLTSVYDCSSNTISKVDDAVRSNIIPKLTGYLPDVKSCANVGQKLSGYLPNMKSCTKIGQNMNSHLPKVDCAKISQELSVYLPDKEGRAKIEELAWIVGKNAVSFGVREGVKFVPGGSFIHQTVLQSLPDEKKGNLTNEVKTLQSRIAMLEKQASESGQSHKLDESSSSNVKLNSQTASSLDFKITSQKPEDVIRIFMMKEFVGRKINQQIVENLIVPGVGKHGK